MSVKYTDNTSKILSDVEKQILQTTAEMGADILELSRQYVSRDTGALSKSARLQLFKNEAIVSYNTKYAVRRHFENNKNPDTLLYLERAGDQVAENPERYITKI